MKYVELTLSGSYRETSSQVKGLSAANSTPVFQLDRFLERCDQIQHSSRIQRVVIVRDTGFSSRLPAGLEAIRRALVRLREAGKELVYYAEDYQFEDMFLASACRTRLIHPEGSISFLGISRNYLYFKKTLSKHSVSVEVFRREHYKSAADMFTEDHVNQFERQQTERFLQTALNRFTTAVSSDLLVTETEIEELMQGRFFTPDEGVDHGWITHVTDIVSYRDELQQQKDRKAKKKKLRGRIDRGRVKIPVLFLEGAIVDGTENKRGLITGQNISGQWFAGKIAEIRKSRAKALILRINSPGGSAAASEVIRAEVVRTAEKMPVIVSMGPVAASGGYWIASAANKIFAHKTTVTGSIGVVSLYFYIRDFLRKQGVTADVVKAGDFADFGSALRKLSARERNEIEQQIERTYQRFIRIVSDGRSIDPMRVREIAGGRVYSGEEALSHGLVDEIGDLADAIEHAKRCVDVTHAKSSFGPRVKRSFVERQLQGSRHAHSAFVSALQADGMATRFNPEMALQEILQTHGKVLALDLDLYQQLLDPQ